MHTDQNTEGPPQPQFPSEIPESQIIQAGPPSRTPAILPSHSPATAAQRLSDIPERPLRGVNYAVPQQLTREPGWRTKRHIKRKNFRQTLDRMAVVERIGTRTLIPLALTVFSLFLISILVFVTISGFVTATNQKFGTKITTLAEILPQDNTKIYDMHGGLIYQSLSQGMQTSVPLKDISLQLIHAEIAIEDQNFYANPGYDITGIVRAALSNMTNKKVVSGGSTITQQLIKNAIVGNQETIIRKLQEIILAPDISRHYSKNQILQMYLNTTYYGEQAYGAEAAAFTYFGLKATPKHTAASQLDLAQAAMLAGIPSSPSARDPFLHPEASAVRMQEVLQQMYTQGYITAQERAVAIEEAQRPDFLNPGTINNRLAPHFVNYTLREVARDLHVKLSDLPRAGLIVNTTLNLQLQNKVLLSAQKHIAEMARSHNMSNAAVVVLEHHTGAIRTLVGNIDPNDPTSGDFDVATQGYRQPGSSFKPYIYATAFQGGMSPGQPVLDGPLTITMCCGLPSYSPSNYDLRYHGLVTYRYALQNSFNIPAVKLLLRTGVDKALKTAQAMGITSYQGIPNYTMVLGSLSIHLIDNTAGYSTFANGGIAITPHAVETIKDQNGNLIFKPQPHGIRALSKEAAFMITDVLSDNNSRIYEFGKCSSLVLYTNTMNQCYGGHPGPTRVSAAKTGTSNDFRDNWTMGYTTDYTVGVWAGNNDNSPMVNVTGVDGAGPIWHDTMMMAEQGRPLRVFPAAPNTLIKKYVAYPGRVSDDWAYKK
jgi:membrane peptidoglycan carboxypeptidase